MHKLAIILAALSLAAPAAAQIDIPSNVNEPITKLPPAKWEKLMAKYLHPGALVGLPIVDIISSVSEPLTVTCGKWTLVGSNVYKSVAGNPSELAPWSVTEIRTNEFDGYCRDGVVGHTAFGRTVKGALTSTDGTFTNATIITFSGEGFNE